MPEIVLRSPGHPVADHGESKRALRSSRIGGLRLPMVSLFFVLLWNAWLYRGVLSSAASLNDMVLHQQMTRFATTSLLHFHLPMTQWYPYLNLGSPQFLHYQGLGAIIVGFFGILVSPTTAFHVITYLLLTLWPLVIYKSARLFEFDRTTAAASAIVSPFLVSAIGIGLEHGSFLWLGYGVWAQLCASWTLPLAWAYTWRALHDSRFVLRSVLFIALTVALHYETGYAAIAAVPLLFLVANSAIKSRAERAFLIGLGVILSTAWIVIPLVVNAKWAAINSAQYASNFHMGYGAKQNLSWLVHGNLFDFGRSPVLTVLLGLGVIACLINSRKIAHLRALLILAVMFFLLSFGPTTWGAFANIVPGHNDIFFRRFLVDVHLAGIFIIGFGFASLCRAAVTLGRWMLRMFAATRDRSTKWLPATVTTVVGGAVLALMAPICFTALQTNNSDVIAQVELGAQQSNNLTPIISFLKHADNGRVYAGLPSNWGQKFKYGYGPLYLYLADCDVDQVSTQGWAASLMEPAQYNFNESNISDYYLFGVRYLLLPAGKKTPVPADLVITSGNYSLYQITSIGYWNIVVPSGYIDENRMNIGAQSLVVLNSHYVEHFVDMWVNFGTNMAAASLPTQSLSAMPGRILSSSTNLGQGEASGTFELSQPADVVLSASFDPGWQAYVDGIPTPTVMMAPAVVGVPVPAGVHTVKLVYRGFSWYPTIFIVNALGIMALAMYIRRRLDSRSGNSPLDSSEAEQR